MRFSRVMYRIGITVAAAWLLAGCAAAPSLVDPKRLEASAPETEPETEPAAIARLMRISSAIQSAHFTSGNRVVLLKDGDQTYPAMLDAIAHATRRIDMESYQFDTQAAPIFADALISKAAQGVAVHLLYDAWGSASQDPSLFDRMRRAGILVVAFNPIGSTPDPDHRDHRKLLVVDNRVAITGGLNVTGVYLNRTSRGSDPEQMRWRDTDVLLEGPVVDQFQTLFIQSWTAEHGPALLPPPPPPPPPPRAPGTAEVKAPGTAEVEAIDGAPLDGHPVIYETLLSAVALSKRSVHLTTGFFGPPPAMLAALKAAARRGVDVAIITAANSDSNASIRAGRSHYHELLEAGVRIYERQGVVLHAKTSVVDGIWAAVGSSNLDWRSTALNNEIDAVVVDPAFGAAMEAMFHDDVAQSKEITLQRWAERGLGERAGELWARLIEEEL